MFIGIAAPQFHHAFGTNRRLSRELCSRRRADRPDVPSASTRNVDQRLLPCDALSFVHIPKQSP
jgi:hypothetical protein